MREMLINGKKEIEAEKKNNEILVENGEINDSMDHPSFNMEFEGLKTSRVDCTP